MNSQNENRNPNKNYAKYQSYNSYNGTGQNANEQSENQLKIERELILMEYETDRDAILKAVKESIKKRDYDDAQAFVYKYRLAAKTDEEFAILAKLLAQKLEAHQKIEKIETLIDATEEGDTKTLISLNKRILRIDPDYPKAKAALQKLTNSDRSPKKKKSRHSDDDDAEENHREGSASVMLTLGMFFATFVGGWLLVMSLYHSISAIGILALILTLALYGYFFIPYPQNIKNTTGTNFTLRIVACIVVSAIYQIAFFP